MCSVPSALTVYSQCCGAESLLGHLKTISHVGPSGASGNFRTERDVAQEQLVCCELCKCSGHLEDDTAHTCLLRNTTGANVSTPIPSTESWASITFTLRCLQ